MGSISAWTPERRARQAEIIRRIKPWTSSTGPRTKAGKAVSSKNARRFLHDPQGGRAYEAIQLLMKHGPDMPMADELWEVARNALDSSVLDEIEFDLRSPCPIDAELVDNLDSEFWGSNSPAKDG